MNKEAARKLLAARSQLVLDQGFFGMLALRLRLVESEDPQIKTLAFDGKHVFYNAPFIMSLSDSLRRSAMAHEVMHGVLGHIGRRAGRNPRKWNQAGDYALNQILKDSGFELGEGWLYNPAYAGMSADQIYSLLPDAEDDKEGSGGGDPFDEMIDGNSAEAAEQAIEWQIATTQAAAIAAQRGKLPASLKRFVEEMNTPKVDWRAQLRDFITQISRNDYSWMRPDRRYLAQGLILPSLYSQNMGLMIDVTDTSGSISNPILQALGSEVIAARNACMPEKLINIYCDAEVNHVDEYGPYDVVKFEGHGGGGTDFRPPFEWVAERGLQPACLIYLTDGYGPFPDVPPPYPVLWCMTTDVVAPFGRTIRIEV